MLQFITWFSEFFLALHWSIIKISNYLIDIKLSHRLGLEHKSLA